MKKEYSLVHQHLSHWFNVARIYVSNSWDRIYSGCTLLDISYVIVAAETCI